MTTATEILGILRIFPSVAVGDGHSSSSANEEAPGHRSEESKVMEAQLDKGEGPKIFLEKWLVRREMPLQASIATRVSINGVTTRSTASVD